MNLFILNDFVIIISLRLNLIKFVLSGFSRPHHFHYLQIILQPILHLKSVLFILNLNINQCLLLFLKLFLLELPIFAPFFKVRELCVNIRHQLLLIFEKVSHVKGLNHIFSELFFDFEEVVVRIETIEKVSWVQNVIFII